MSEPKTDDLAPLFTVYKENIKRILGALVELGLGTFTETEAYQFVTETVEDAIKAGLISPDRSTTATMFMLLRLFPDQETFYDKELEKFIPGRSSLQKAPRQRISPKGAETPDETPDATTTPLPFSLALSTEMASLKAGFELDLGKSLDEFRIDREQLVRLAPDTPLRADRLKQLISAAQAGSQQDLTPEELDQVEEEVLPRLETEFLATGGRGAIRTGFGTFAASSDTVKQFNIELQEDREPTGPPFGTEAEEIEQLYATGNRKGAYKRIWEMYGIDERNIHPDELEKDLRDAEENYTVRMSVNRLVRLAQDIESRSRVRTEKDEAAAALKADVAKQEDQWTRRQTNIDRAVDYIDRYARLKNFSIDKQKLIDYVTKYFTDAAAQGEEPLDPQDLAEPILAYLGTPGAAEREAVEEFGSVTKATSAVTAWSILTGIELDSAEEQAAIRVLVDYAEQYDLSQGPPLSSRQVLSSGAFAGPDPVTGISPLESERQRKAFAASRIAETTPEQVSNLGIPAHALRPIDGGLGVKRSYMDRQFGTDAPLFPSATETSRLLSGLGSDVSLMEAISVQDPGLIAQAQHTERLRDQLQQSLSSLPGFSVGVTPKVDVGEQFFNALLAEQPAGLQALARPNITEDFRRFLTGQGERVIDPRDPAPLVSYSTPIRRAPTEQEGRTFLEDRIQQLIPQHQANIQLQEEAEAKDVEATELKRRRRLRRGGLTVFEQQPSLSFR